MQYISTRGKSPPRPFAAILLEGLARDGGLFVPEEYPRLSEDELQMLRGKPYYVVACTVLRMFMPDIERRALHKIIGGAYNRVTFGSVDIAPVVQLEPGLHLLKLSEGPTLAFKDMAMQPLGGLMEHVLQERGAKLNILGATSGDTGSAAEYAMRGRDRVNVFMLSPFGRMSPFQRKQMYTLTDANIYNIAINGPFDDCQRVVKAVNSDAAFKEEHSIGAVNSINWARIACQVVYYVWAYLQVVERIGDPVQFAVPSGNFGNALSSHIARQMGLPIETIVCTNENDVLDVFFTTGVYRVRRKEDVLVTSSPSRDIAEASHLERWVYDFVGRNSAIVEHCWKLLAKEGAFDVKETNPGRDFGMSSARATQAEVLETIKQIYEQYKVIIDPHTAVAMKVGLEKRDRSIPLVIAETAQPAKFAETIHEAIGMTPEVPSEYEELEELPERFERMDPDPEEVKRFIAAHV